MYSENNYNLIYKLGCFEIWNVEDYFLESFVY